MLRNQILNNNIRKKTQQKSNDEQRFLDGVNARFIIGDSIVKVLAYISTNMTQKKLVLHDQFSWLNHVNKSKKGNAYSDFFQKGKYWFYENPTNQ